MPNTIRPTKKQQELLEYVSEFIATHGYSPSYREIMKGCNYTSVATVALHVNSLIGRGHIVKRGRSARSLEVVSNPVDISNSGDLNITSGQEKWLVDAVTAMFKKAEGGVAVPQNKIDELYVLVGALKVLGLDDAATSFIPRLSALKNK